MFPNEKKYFENKIKEIVNHIEKLRKIIKYLIISSIIEAITIIILILTILF